MSIKIWRILLGILFLWSSQLQAFSQTKVSNAKVDEAFFALEDDNETRALQLIKTVNRDSRNESGQTLLIVACKNKRFQVAEILITAGADLNAVTTTGFHTMFFISDTNNETLLDRAVRRGGKLDVRAPDGTTLLHRAAEDGLLSSIRYLISKKADLNARTTAGGTPLMFAASNGKSKVIKELLAAGADPRLTVLWDNNSPEGLQITAYTMAQRQRYGESAEILREALGLPKPFDTTTSYEGDPW